MIKDLDVQPELTRPKKPLPLRLQFRNFCLPHLQNLSQTDASKKVDKLWAELGDEGQNEWKKKVADATLHYKQNVKIWRARNPIYYQMIKKRKKDNIEDKRKSRAPLQWQEAHEQGAEMNQMMNQMNKQMMIPEMPRFELQQQEPEIDQQQRQEGQIQNPNSKANRKPWK